MIIKDITLTRKIHGNYNNLFGELKVRTKHHGTFKFATVENYEKKIKHGYYNIEYTPSAKFGKKTLELTGVKNRTGIRIHPSNRGSDLEGCIGIGILNHKDEIPTQIYYSRMSTEILESMLWNHIQVIHIIDETENNRETSTINSTEAIGVSN